MNDNESLILPQAKLDEAKSEGKQSKLSNDIQDWLLKNQKASMDAKQSLNEYYRELSSGRVSNDRLDYIRQELDDIDTAQRELGKLSKNLKDQFAEAYKSVTMVFCKFCNYDTHSSVTKDAKRSL